MTNHLIFLHILYFIYIYIYLFINFVFVFFLFFAVHTQAPAEILTVQENLSRN